ARSSTAIGRTSSSAFAPRSRAPSKSRSSSRCSTHASSERGAAMASSLIRGKYVVTKVTSRTEAHVVPDGAVFQRDGSVVEVGRYAALATRHRPDEVLGSPDHVVLPGFVNGHHHVGLTPFQLGSSDYALELWFASRMAARGVDPYLDTLYSAF